MSTKKVSKKLKQADEVAKDAQKTSYSQEEINKAVSEAYSAGQRERHVPAREYTTEEKIERAKQSLRLNEVIKSLEDQIRTHSLASIELQNRIQLLRETPALLDINAPVLYTPQYHGYTATAVPNIAPIWVK